jgi:threonine/homoserine/homoserine lactone efflux protein
MPPLHQMVKFAAYALVILLIPGPSVLFIVSRGVALGRKAALATVAGNTIGAVTQLVLVALGLGSLLERSVALFNVVKFIGAAYLLWMGWHMWRDRNKLATNVDLEVAKKSPRVILREGFVVGVTNPKVAVTFAAVLPTFADKATGHYSLQLLILGSMFCGIGLVTDSMIGFAAGTARQWMARDPNRLRKMSGFGGLAIMGLGINLALTGKPTKA